MAIPAISSYKMPKESNLPKNKVGWKVDPNKSVLLIHDMQQYFIDYYEKDSSLVREMIANIKVIRKQCDELGIPVVYTAQSGNQNPEERALLTDFWGTGLKDDPNITKVIDELAPGKVDIVLKKWRYSAFKKSNLLEMMNEQGRDQLIICGVYAHIGCLMTAGEAFMSDIKPFFIADAVADFTQPEHEMAINYVAGRCGAVYSTAQIMDQLKREASAEAELV